MGWGKAFGEFFEVFNRKDKKRSERKEVKRDAEPSDLVKKGYLGRAMDAFFKRRRLRVHRQKNNSK